MDQDYKDLVEMLWNAYKIYVSAGCGHGAFERHIWPVIKAARKKVMVEIIMNPEGEGQAQ